MGQLNSYSKSICPIDILSDDALLYVFSYLTPLDKIKSVRVCQKWNRLLTHPSVWRTIHIGELKRFLNLGVMIDSQGEVERLLQFLRRYAGPSTKRFQLQARATSCNQVLEFLCTTCTQLDTLLLQVKSEPVWNLNLALLPTNLTSLVLQLYIVGGNDKPLETLEEKHVWRLQRLELSGVLLTDALCRSLLQHSKGLCHLRLSQCIFDRQSGSKFITLMGKLRLVALKLCQFSSTEQLEKILFNIGVKCNKLESFELCLPCIAANSTTQNVTSEFDIDNFLKSSIGLRMLINLNLAGIDGMTGEAFAVFSQQHKNLETLELSHRDVNDDFLFTIATNLVKLRSLQLRGCESITDVGLNYLAHHPRLQNLTLACSKITGKAVSSTVCTLPKIRHLSLSEVHGYKKCVETLNKRLPLLTISFINYMR